MAGTGRQTAEADGITAWVGVPTEPRAAVGSVLPPISRPVQEFDEIRSPDGKFVLTAKEQAEAHTEGRLPRWTRSRMTGVNAVLGPTAGPAEGNTRAILSIGLAIGYCLLLGFLMYVWLMEDKEQAQDLVVAGWGALGIAFGLITGSYLGKRDSEVS
jgi:hypothetical protein